VDYQSKIIIDATKALKDLTALSKVLQSNDVHVKNLNKNSTALNKTLSKASAEVGKLNTQTKRLSDSTKKSAVNTGKLVTQTKYLNASLKKSVANSKLLTTQTKSLNASMKNSTRSIKMLSTQTKTLNTSLSNSVKSTKALVTTNKSLDTSIRSNITSMSKLNSSINMNNTAIKKNNAALVNMSKTMSTLSAAVNKSITGMRTLASQTKTLNANLAKNSANILALKNSMTSLGAATNKSAMELANFNRNSAMLNASLNANTMALNKLSKQMMLLGVSLNANTAAMSKYRRVSVATASSQKALGISMGFVNKFLKIQLVLFRTAMLAATAYAGIKLYIEFNKTAESLDLMGRKLETFTGNTEALDIVKTSAFKTGFAIQDLGRIITRFAITTEGAFSTSTLAKWTEGLVMSARAAGTSTTEMNNALIQLSQSFSAGFLMGDEYRSISENLPLFKMALRDVADEAGYAGQSLKELSSGRKLDIELMTKALERLSETSMEYTFALDNIEAAEQRVKIGWDLWANAVAESRALKDSLNFLAGLLANLANDGAAMNAMTAGFPDMAKDVEELTTFLFDLYDTSGLVYDSWARLFAFMELPGDETFRMEAIAGSIELVYDALNDLPINIKTVTTIMLSSFMSFKNSVVILFETLYQDLRMGFIDTFGTIDKYITRIRIGFNEVTGDDEEVKSLRASLEATNQVLAENNKQYENLWANAGKRLEAEKTFDANIQQMALADRDKVKVELDHEKQMNKDFREAIREDAKNQAQITAEIDKGYTKRKVTDKKAVTAYNNAVKKSTKDLIKFREEQAELNNEIEKLKNPFDKAYDSFDDKIDLEKKLEVLANARKLNTISQEEFNTTFAKAIEQTKEYIELNEANAINELARSYDDVKAATYEYAEVQYDLNILKEKGKISNDAYNRSLFESERALKLVLARAGEMSQQDQMFQGMKDGLDDFSLNSKTVFEEMSEITTKSFNSMTDQLAEFVTTGKMDVRSLVDSIIKDLARLAIQKSITEPLAASFSSVIGSIFGGATSSSMITSQTGFTGGTSGVLSGAEFATWANGGAFNKGVQAFANGGIVNKPTLFPFADGTGLMGEAGPEAIMPLTRKNGKLGVEASGTKSENNTTVNVYNNSTGSQATTKETTDDKGHKTIDVMIEEKINASIQNGSLDKQMGSVYGVKRRGF